MMQWDSVGLTSKPEPPPGEDGPLSVEPLPVDEATEAAIQDSVKRAVARVGPHPPVTAAELTAHLHDLLSARGQRSLPAADGTRDAIETTDPEWRGYHAAPTARDGSKHGVHAP